MHLFDFLEAWLFSMDEVLRSSGVTAAFERTPVDRPNPGCNLNMRWRNQEINLTMWESGHADLIEGSYQGAISQAHFEDVRNPTDFGNILSKLVDFAVLVRPE